MKLVTYEQIISTDLWMECDAIDTFQKLFTQIPQVVYLIKQGYEPAISKWNNYQSKNLHIAYQFRIPEAELTWICLQWPDAVSSIDYDSMITTIENRNGTT
jgi:hypothetical protein